MKALFSTVVLLILSLSCLRAQQKPQNPSSSSHGQSIIFHARITDSTTHQPIEYATVSLLRPGNTRPLAGAITNNKGNFTITINAAGDAGEGYKITIECIGYSPRSFGPFQPGDKQILNLGDFLLSKKTADLQAVTVTAPRDLVQNKLDKMVYNAEKDLTSLGGVATDVLKKVPMVSVDIDGNVQLMGNSNILFLINGQPSSIFGNNLADALQTIPASQIKSIEVITSPGAKYDAEGTGGIINIILKDNKLNGINGNISLTGGSRLQNGSVNLNARRGGFGLNAFFSGNAQLSSLTHTSSLRNSYDSIGQQVNSLSQDGSSNLVRNGFQSGLGMDWELNKWNKFSGNLGFDNFGNHNDGSYQQEELDYSPPATAPTADIQSLVSSANKFRAHSLDWALRYKRTFSRQDQELDLSLDGSEGSNKSSYNQSQSLPSGDSTYAGSQGISTGQDHEMNIRVDYSQPLAKSIQLETGGRIQLRHITSNSPIYTLDPYSGLYPYDSSQSNTLSYRRHVYAAYISLSFPLFNFLEVKSGIRYERTETEAGFSKAPDATIPGYNTFVPSITIAHTFNDNQQIKLAYTRRIQRPDYRSLNPWVNAVDPKNLVRGNPFLQPEIGDNFELGYSMPLGEGASLNTALFYRRNTHDIQPFIEYYDAFPLGDTVYSNVSVSTPMNVGSENNYGLNIYGSAPIGKKLNLRSNISVFDRYITPGTLGSQPITSFNYRINLNATYLLSSNVTLEFFGNFNSSRNEIQGRYPSFTSYNFAARKQFWHKKGSLAFTTTNPFSNVVNQATVVSGQGFTLNSLRQVPYRSFGLNFTWKFGKLEFKKEKEETKDNDNAGE